MFSYIESLTVSLDVDWRNAQQGSTRTGGEIELGLGLLPSLFLWMNVSAS